MTERSGNHIVRVLFCGPHFAAAHDFTREYLQKYQYIQVDVVPLDDVPNVIGNYHLCVVKNKHLDEKVIAEACEMKLIMQFGVGLEGVDIDAATRHGIKVAKIPSNMTGNSASCAEMAIYLMFGLLRKQKEIDIAVKQKKLGEPVGQTLLGKTVFILGFGDIGRDLAKRLRPFGVKIIGTKRNWNQYNDDDLIDVKGGPERMYDFAAEADIVVACIYFSSETAGIIDDRFISSMKQGALIVNVARGGVLDYSAVLHHLCSGHLGGLGTDVAWAEPFDPEDPILRHPNVILTPHIGGVTELSYRKMAEVVGECALQLHAGVSLTGIEFVN